MRKSTMLLVFLSATACAGEVPKVSTAASPLGRNEPAAVAAAPVRARADLKLPRGAAFEVERQVSELRAAIALYTQFLERAEGRPELGAAVEKARERIADVRQTIVFLESAPPSEDALPH